LASGSGDNFACSATIGIDLVISFFVVVVDFFLVSIVFGKAEVLVISFFCLVSTFVTFDAFGPWIKSISCFFTGLSSISFDRAEDLVISLFCMVSTFVTFGPWINSISCFFTGLMFWISVTISFFCTISSFFTCLILISFGKDKALVISVTIFFVCTVSCFFTCLILFSFGKDKAVVISVTISFFISTFVTFGAWVTLVSILLSSANGDGNLLFVLFIIIRTAFFALEETNSWSI